MTGRYCARCGERALDPDDLRLRHFIAEAVHVVTDADSRLFRSYHALIARPGLLTAEYVRGRRRPYLLPLQLFLIANILYFFVQSLAGFDTLTTTLHTHLEGQPYRQLTSAMVTHALEARDITLRDYAIRFNATSQAQAKTMVIIMVPLFVPFLALAFVRRRPPIVQHLAFATHYFTFLLVLLTASGVVFTAVWHVSRRLDADPSWLLNDAGVSLILGGFILAYFTLALRRAYGAGWAAAALKGLFLVAAQFLVLQLYRLILFFTTFYSV